MNRPPCLPLAILFALLAPSIALAQATTKPSEPRQHPALFLVGDSIMRTGTNNGLTGPWGWGYEIVPLFDPTKIHVYNQGLGGRSSRGYIEEGAWAKVLADIEPGDYILIEFGHNDAADSQNYPNRMTAPGNGDDLQQVQSKITNNQTMVHSYGWYLRQYVKDAKAKGATVIICSSIPRNQWTNGKINRGFDGYAAWAEEAAKQSGALFMPLNEIAADHYDALGQEETRKYFNDLQHTKKIGAQLNARSVVEGIHQLKGCDLANDLLPATTPATQPAASSAVQPIIYAADNPPTAIISRSPDQNAKSVCIDTHLNITFNAPPTLGKTGTIRIYDSAGNKLVDTIDIALPNNQQAYVIGGSSLHARPVIITGNTAVIYPHNNTLQYNKTYSVQIDPGVLIEADQPFPGYSSNTDWTFSTKSAPPPADTDKVTVAADGTGDFATIQGAIDFVPANNSHPLTIFIKKGTYTEIVCFNGKNNVTFLGEDREQTIVAYSNNNTFQPNSSTPETPFAGSSYRRGVFMGLNSANITLTNFTIRNTTPKGGSQAEAIIFKEVRGQKEPNASQTILSHMNLYSYQDTLQISGKAYLDDTYIEGDTDYMWGNGPCFFQNCNFKTLTNGTSFTQPRNTTDHHGFVFVDCKFDGAPSVTRASLGNGSGASEVVLIDCALGTMLTPTGWASRGANNSQYNTTNLSDGKPYDMSKWPTWIKHLTMEKDADTIANYRNSSWVLDGWTPATQPAEAK